MRVSVVEFVFVVDYCYRFLQVRRPRTRVGRQNMRVAFSEFLIRSRYLPVFWFDLNENTKVLFGTIICAYIFFLKIFLASCSDLYFTLIFSRY